MASQAMQRAPFSPGDAVDVRGLPSGTLITCPYTQRELIAP